MRNFFRPVVALLWKDILLEAKTRDIVVAVLVFSLLVIVVFNFVIEPIPQLVGLIAPGVLWVAVVFGSVLGMTRSFAIEKENGNLQGLILAPVGRDAIFFGKMLSNFLFIMVVEIAVFPIFSVLYNLPLVSPGMIIVAVLATLGISTIGTLLSAIAANTRAREVMLPVLFFPVVIPVILASVEATGILIDGAGFAKVTRWISLLVAFDAIFLVVCPFAFHLVVED